MLPAFTIGLASYLAVLEAMSLATGRQVYRDVFHYWLRVFAVVFGMGVVSGVVMAYEFGTNWARFADKAGPIVGPLMGYEVMTAFFLEAGFLGILLFGRQRVGRGVYFAATLLVATGTLISAFWILAANSWMQTPQGYTMTPDGRFMPADWWQIIFNPSFPYRLVHMVIASYLCVAFVVGAVGAYHLRRDTQNQAARLMFSMAMWMAVVVAPIQILAGDQHGLNTRQYQPAKVAALEGDWDTQPGTPLILFGMPNMAEERTNWAIEVPHLGALVLTHTWNGAVEGLKSFPPAGPAQLARHLLGVSHHGGTGSADGGRWRMGSVAARTKPAVRVRGGFATSCWRWRHRDSSRCCQAGQSQRSAASRSPSTACCAQPIARRRSACPVSRRHWQHSSLCMRSCSARASSSCFVSCAGHRR